VAGHAQDIKLTVTGSNIIPRIEGETALPVQVITREEIERANIQTAAELMNTVSANMSFNAFNETQSIAGAPFQPGFAGPSLRGLSYNRTLILLNGRRLVNYALSANGVDLNFIPVEAIERVEVLKDGASAIYGSDAIAGVINFILRKNYRGAAAYAQYSSPEHTGGYSTHYSASAGYGDLASDKFNVFATIDYQKFGGIKARDRPFSSSNYLPSDGVDQTSRNSFPGNVIIGGVARNPTGDPNNGYLNSACLPPLSFPTVNSPTRCGFDNASTIDIFDPSERFNVIGALTWKINPENELFLQGLYVKNRFTFTSSPASITNMTLPATSAFYPHAFAQFFGVDGRPLNITWRSYELGPRTDETTSDQWNIVAGMRGVQNGWDYNGALAYSQSNVNDRYVDGYTTASTLIPILNSGVVNPFGFNTPGVVALMSTSKLNQTVRTGRSTLSSVDFHATKEIYLMPAGPLAIAVGGEARQWKINQESAAVLASGAIPGIGSIPSVSANRTVWAAFAEANVPLVKTLEGNLAARFDHYSDFGSTTNPKLSLRWQPAKTFLMRASVGTGFKAPGLDVIHGPPQFGNTPNADDPIRCPVTHAAQDCNTAFPANFGGNPSLQADKSTQWGMGGVWAPTPGVSLGVDYFDILIKDAITSLSAVTVFQQCPDGINGPTCQFIHRGPVDPRFPNLPGPIVLVDTFLTNFGRVRTSGIDLSAQVTFPRLDWGQLKLGFQGTYTIKYRQQQGNGGYVDLVNHELSPGLIPYWRHYVSLYWDYGAWSATLTDNFQTGTYDAPPTTNPLNGTTQRKIGDYDLWNISGSYTGFKNWTLSAGIKNIFDRDPPLSIQIATSANAGQVGYDPTYTDPHGRLYWASVRYSFR
jgi:iron complex outermembrane receptor protein